VTERKLHKTSHIVNVYVTLISIVIGVVLFACASQLVGDGREERKPVITQSEIAGGRLTGATEFPTKGLRLNDFQLPATSGKKVSLSDYRGHTNLVLIAAGGGAGTDTLLVSLAKQYSKIEELQAAVLLIVQRPVEAAAWKSKRLHLPYLTLVDGDGRVHSELGATAVNGTSRFAIYVTDRFGEVFGAYRLRDLSLLPSVKDILDWLEFINSQCPECGFSEWPA
jgi:peroxiredoxin